jgi:hypothetical protein
MEPWAVDPYPSTRTPAPPEAEVAPQPESVRSDDTEPERAFEGIIAKLCARNRGNSHAAIFRAVGLRDRKLEPQEANCARRTPKISWMNFCKMFGAGLHCERGKAVIAAVGYDAAGDFLCTSIVAQPFAPIRIGGAGVILSSPGATLHNRFHVFMDPSPNGRRTLRYCGIYTTAHDPMEVQVDEWHSLPTQVSTSPHPRPGVLVTTMFCSAPMCC